MYLYHKTYKISDPIKSQLTVLHRRDIRSMNQVNSICLPYRPTINRLRPTHSSLSNKVEDFNTGFWKCKTKKNSTSPENV